VDSDLTDFEDWGVGSGWMVCFALHDDCGVCDGDGGSYCICGGGSDGAIDVLLVLHVVCEDVGGVRLTLWQG
jgi:hypothetical protein